jgi:hypothetical protein
MINRKNLACLFVGASVGIGGMTLLLPQASLRAAEEKAKVTNADYARDAQEHLKKAHEDVDHLVNSQADKKAKGYADAEEAKKAIDRADKALGRYVAGVDGK